MNYKQDFETYINEVKSLLKCNYKDENCEHILYLFSNEQVNENIDYFMDCMESDLSPYKSLLFFDVHLEKKDN